MRLYDYVTKLKYQEFPYQFIDQLFWTQEIDVLEAQLLRQYVPQLVTAEEEPVS